MSLPIAAIRQLRPKQWAKNVFVLAALIFSRSYTDTNALLLVAAAFAGFSLVASAGYVLNDWLDAEADRQHPKKKHRPIASGALPSWAAGALLAAATAAGIGLGVWISLSNGSWLFLAVLLAYFATTLSYSFFFKHQVILDVMVLALCYVWRVVGGAVAIGVAVSPWLFLCTAFISLFIGFNKRRAELASVGAGGETRKVIGRYSPTMIQEFQSIVTGNTVLSYVLYTVLGPTPWMTLTVPFVLYAVFRYIYLVDREGAGEAPDETLLKDKPILAAGLLYVITAVLVLEFAPASLAS